MKIEDFEINFNHTTNSYEFSKEEFEEILKKITPLTQKSGGMTENGVKILKIMQDNFEKYINIFTSKNIGEILFMSPRSVSGSMKKLITDGLVEKIGSNPVSYGLTELGKNYQFDRE